MLTLQRNLSTSNHTLPIKFFSQRLFDQTQHQFGNKRDEYGTSFRPNRSCLEQMLNLNVILRYQKIYIKIFVDFTKAYDSIDRQSLLQILKEQCLNLKTKR